MPTKEHWERYNRQMELLAELDAAWEEFRISVQLITGKTIEKNPVPQPMLERK